MLSVAVVGCPAADFRFSDFRLSKMDYAVARRIVRFCGLTTATVLLGACAIEPPLAATRNQIIISVRDQKLTVVKDDHTRVVFPISTSKFGLGDRRNTYETPSGELAVAAKIGGGAPAGSVFHGRVRTGEIVKVDAPGRDAIVSRILALRGLEAGNSQAFSRGIYIHGTPEERNIGRPTSYGCIRMRSRDVIALYDMVRVGARVQIIDTTQNQAIAANIVQPSPGNPFDTPAPNIPLPDVNATQVASAGNTSVVKSITTTGSGPTVKTTTTAVAAGGASPATTTTTVTKTAPPFPAVAAALNKKTWNAAPEKLLAKQAATDARAQREAAKPPVGAPTPTQPVSNNTSGTNGTDPSAQHRSAVDSL